MAMPDGLVDRQRSALDLLLERLAFVEVHDDEHLAVSRFVDVVDRADVVVLEGGGGFGLVDETLLGFGVAGEMAGGT